MTASACVSRSADETERLGEAISPELAAGDVVLLSGQLGAGKTRLVAGIARGLGCAARVRSPSFTLVNEYSGRLKLVHLDLYRVDRAEVAGLGIEESAEGAALVVEWGERLPARWQQDALRLEFEVLSVDRRQIDASAHGPRGTQLLAAWRRASSLAEPLAGPAP